VRSASVTRIDARSGLTVCALRTVAAFGPVIAPAHGEARNAIAADRAHPRGTSACHASPETDADPPLISRAFSQQ
jgi:hypothetical protein